jgi:hypothetical protein
MSWSFSYPVVHDENEMIHLMHKAVDMGIHPGGLICHSAAGISLKRTIYPLRIP